jgi:hypothetical protein
MKLVYAKLSGSWLRHAVQCDSFRKETIMNHRPSLTVLLACGAIALSTLMPAHAQMNQAVITTHSVRRLTPREIAESNRDTPEKKRMREYQNQYMAATAAVMERACKKYQVSVSDKEVIAQIDKDLDLEAQNQRVRAYHDLKAAWSRNPGQAEKLYQTKYTKLISPGLWEKIRLGKPSLLDTMRVMDPAKKDDPAMNLAREKTRSRLMRTRLEEALRKNGEIKSGGNIDIWLAGQPEVLAITNTQTTILKSQALPVTGAKGK